MQAEAASRLGLVQVAGLMSRSVIKPGDVLQIPLSTEGTYGYAQWLLDGTARFFLYSGPVLPVDQVTKLPPAFRVVVFKDTPRRYGWTKIGNTDIPGEFSQPQRYVMKDILTGELSIYHEPGDGAVEQWPATLQEVAGLETNAVWAHPHVVERLEAQLSGKPSLFLSGLSVEG